MEGLLLIVILVQGYLNMRFAREITSQMCSLKQSMLDLFEVNRELIEVIDKMINNDEKEHL